jgi:hypothetical protein
MVDLESIFLNLSQSLGPVQALITGLGYLIGLSFLVIALFKFKKIGDSRVQSQSQEKMFVPTAFVVMGAGLIFLPSALSTMSNTFFGSNNVLAYSPDTGNALTNAIELFIQTAGVLWFVRGSVLLAQSSEPGAKEGSKGLAFIVAGILALNFDATTSAVGAMLDHLFSLLGSARSDT